MSELPKKEPSEHEKVAHFTSLQSSKYRLISSTAFFLLIFISCCSDCIFAFKCSRSDKLRVAVCVCVYVAISITPFGRHSARYIVQHSRSIHSGSLCTYTQSESIFPSHSSVFQITALRSHALRVIHISSRERERENKLSLLLRLLFVCTI